MKTYTGKNIVKGYCRWFRVSNVCALTELKMCGIAITDDMIEAARLAEQEHAAARAKQKAAKKVTEPVSNDLRDDNFAFIAGYTSWGFPYGTTWDEL